MKHISVITLIFCFHTYAQEKYIAPGYEEAATTASQFLDSIKTSQNIPAISVAVGVNGEIIWQEAMGFANVDQQEKAELSTTFRVGSIAKPMTAIGLAILVDQEKLSWDDKVSTYVSEYADKKFEMSIRQVAGHTAGIRHYKGAEFVSKKQYNSVEESLDIFKDDKLKFEPGTEYNYSTYGYVLLSRIMEVVSGTNYLDFMDEYLFKPSGMSLTVPEHAGREERGKSGFYNKKGDKEVMAVNLSNKWAGGGFLSTPTDLVKMIHNLNNLISEETWNQLITPQTLTHGESTGYGMGFNSQTLTSLDRVLIHHGGRSMGARAYLMYLPQEDVVVAICANTSADYGAQEAYDVAKFFLK
jgi:CubicO group peptidase (beta-lactamase class C family)